MPGRATGRLRRRLRGGSDPWAATAAGMRKSSPGRRLYKPSCPAAPLAGRRRSAGLPAPRAAAAKAALRSCRNGTPPRCLFAESACWSVPAAALGVREARPGCFSARRTRLHRCSPAGAPGAHPGLGVDANSSPAWTPPRRSPSRPLMVVRSPPGVQGLKLISDTPACSKWTPIAREMIPSEDAVLRVPRPTGSPFRFRIGGAAVQNAAGRKREAFALATARCYASPKGLKTFRPGKRRKSRSRDADPPYELTTC
jgi:hypothetical protein